MNENCDEKAIHGRIFFLSSDGKIEFEGTGVFVEDRKRLYASIGIVDTYKNLIEYRIVFIPDIVGNGHSLLFLDSYFDYFPVDDGMKDERVFSLENYIYIDSLNDAVQILLNGFKGITLEIDAVSERSKTRRFFRNGTEYIEGYSFGAAETIAHEHFPNGIDIGLASSFSIADPLNPKSILITTIQLPLPVSIDDYRALLEPIELYWVLFNPGTRLNIRRANFIVERGEGIEFKMVSLSSENLLERKHEKDIIIERPEIELSVLGKIIEQRTKGLTDKIAFGFSNYLAIHKSKDMDIQIAILYLASMLDSICSEIAKEERSRAKKKKLRLDVEKVQKLIEETDLNISKEVRDFYLDDARKVLASVGRQDIKNTISEAAQKLGVDYTGRRREAVEKIIKIRNQFMHGRKYNLDSQIASLRGYSVVEKEEQGDGVLVRFGFNSGYISYAMGFARQLGMHYFSGEIEKGANRVIGH